MDAVSSLPIFQILIFIAGSSVVTVVVKSLFDKRNNDRTSAANEVKTKADAAAVLSDAALAIAVKATSDAAVMDAKIESMRSALQEHREWDRKMVVKLQQAGIEFDDPPYLWI